MILQVIRVLVVRLQQQAIGWTSGSATHGTGKILTSLPAITKSVARILSLCCYPVERKCDLQMALLGSQVHSIVQGLGPRRRHMRC